MVWVVLGGCVVPDVVVVLQSQVVVVAVVEVLVQFISGSSIPVIHSVIVHSPLTVPQWRGWAQWHSRGGCVVPVTVVEVEVEVVPQWQSSVGVEGAEVVVGISVVVVGSSVVELVVEVLVVVPPQLFSTGSQWLSDVDQSQRQRPVQPGRVVVVELVVVEVVPVSWENELGILCTHMLP